MCADNIFKSCWMRYMFTMFTFSHISRFDADEAERRQHTASALANYLWVLCVCLYDGASMPVCSNDDVTAHPIPQLFFGNDIGSVVQIKRDNRKEMWDACGVWVGAHHKAKSSTWKHAERYIWQRTRGHRFHYKIFIYATQAHVDTSCVGMFVCRLCGNEIIFIRLAFIESGFGSHTKKGPFFHACVYRVG